MVKTISKDQAFKLYLIATDDDNFWEHHMEYFYCEKTDTFPTIYDVMSVFGLNKEDVDRIEKTSFENLK